MFRRPDLVDLGQQRLVVDVTADREREAAAHLLGRQRRPAAGAAGGGRRTAHRAPGPDHSTPGSHVCAPAFPRETCASVLSARSLNWLSVMPITIDSSRSLKLPTPFSGRLSAPRL